MKKSILVLVILCIGQKVYAEFPICTELLDQSKPSISGNIVVWYDNRNGNSDIYGYDINTSTEFSICTELLEQSSPSISGDIVVWYDDRNGNGDIYGYDINTSTEFPVCIDLATQEDPSVNGDIVVWQDERNGNYDIYGSDMSGNNECYNATEVVENVPHIGSTVDSLGGVSISSCSYNDFHDVWHWFMPAVSGDYAISLCGSDFDTTLLVLGGCEDEEVVCNDDYCGKQSRVTLKARAGYKYLIRVAGHDGSKGNYTLNISECTIMESDLNGDCIVNFTDFSKMANEWLADGN